jgi:hypothetical protein
MGRTRRAVSVRRRTGSVQTQHVKERRFPTPVSRRELDLSGLQVLKDTNTFANTERTQLLEQLADRGDGLMFGIYREPAVDHPAVDATLGLANVITIEVNAYTTEETVALLKGFYYPRWKSAGYSFEDDAFASVIKLERGAWIEKRRVTLPLVAVMLAENTMVTAGNGEPMLIDVAQAALRELKTLAVDEQDAAQVHQDLAMELKKAGDAILSRIETAKSGFFRVRQPFVVKDKQGNVVLTNEHVVSQLICPDNSEFDYPGYRPEGAKDD